jgi:hypothetical protein
VTDNNGGVAAEGRIVADDQRLLIDIAQAVLARCGDETWTLQPRDFWCYVTPPGGRRRAQGWKLHVSATQLSAPVILARVVEVLGSDRCAFKFARGLDQLADLLSSLCDRGAGGKFITVYPADDEQFRRLALELDRVTDGLPGPVILSDRQLRPGSLVFYRYGTFSADKVLSNDGSFESMLVGPEGQREKDRRLAWFSPPVWAVSPFPEEPGAVPVPAEPGPVLIADRFVVREAALQSYAGGVYWATDRQTGADVVLKQARPWAAAFLAGTDTRDLLRYEADMLDRLTPLGITPRTVALFTYQENLFLAQELVPGVTLRRWASERCVDAWQGRGAPLAEAVKKTGQLVELMATLHGQGLVLRDFTPNNIMVTPDDRLRLVDLEHAAPVGARLPRAYTLGYAGMEMLSAPRFGPVPSQQSDLYSLGASIFYLASSLDPLLPDDDPAQRSLHGRLSEFVSAVGTGMEAVRRLAPLILGLMHDDPDHRWSLGRAREFLDAVTPVRRAGPRADRPPIPVERLVTDGLRHILRDMRPDAPWLWEADTFGSTTDPCNVQHGAAGVLGVLTQCARTLGDDHVRDAMASAAHSMQQRLFGIPLILPGLYFGRSGTAWSLFDAARFLTDDQMAEQAVELAKQVPVEWPNPDICHGAAGAGMAQLYLWQATGDPEFERRGIQAADCVLRAARERDGLLIWPIPDDFESDLAGLVHYGFAHGVAGTGAFLLYSALATGRSDYLEAACRAGETLEAVAHVEEDAAWWPSGQEKEPVKTRLRHWCSGSSGVGTFLIRLWAHTGEWRFRNMAEAAGAAIRRDRWYSSNATCHGLPGDGEFLLDLADFTGERHYRDWAEELAAVMHARHMIKDGLVVLPDENFGTTVGYQTGLSGAVHFLLRLRHGGPRQWMLDEFGGESPAVRPGSARGRLVGTVQR